MDRRSAGNLVVLLVIATGISLFILNKAEQAIAEIRALNDTPVFLERRSMGNE